MDKISVLRHIHQLNDYIGMPHDACILIEDMIEKIAADPDFDRKCKGLTAYVFAAKDSNRERIIKLANEHGVDEDLFCLVMCELYSIESQKLYQSRNIPSKVYYDSMKDIAIWTNTYHEETGKWGMLQYGRILSSLFADIVRLGRLQFHIISFEHESAPVTVGPITLNRGCSIINIHIPEGDSITKEKRLDSYRQAYKYFNQTGYAVFMCSSWLLYPKHAEFLPQTSNIVDFAKDFKMLSSGDDNNDMKRIFKSAWTNCNGNYDLLPQDTSLKRAFVQRLKSGKTGGRGFGVFVFDGENIIS